MRLDLHIHTVASDGAWTPEEVVDGAAQGRLDVVAVADHDTVAGVEAAVRTGRAVNVHVVPASELSSTRAGREIHILGLFIDPTADAILAHQERAHGLRMGRMARIVERLRGQGLDVTLNAVLDVAGPRRHMVGRPHLARVLVDSGYVASVPEAFDRYIGDAHDAFLPAALMDPVDAVDVVVRSGGIPVWAHPPGDLVEPLLGDLVAAGLKGLEVYRPMTRPAQLQRLKSFADSAGLFVSGGSDWHGPERGEPLGSFFVTGEEVAKLLEAGGL